MQITDTTTSRRDNKEHKQIEKQQYSLREELVEKGKERLTNISTSIREVIFRGEKKTNLNLFSAIRTSRTEHAPKSAVPDEVWSEKREMKNGKCRKKTGANKI